VIRVLLNTIFTVVAQAICIRPGNPGEVKQKATHDLKISHDNDIILGTASPGDMVMKGSYGMY
jgi:hypothetical protein